jgi:hypothetical protein
MSGRRSGRRRVRRSNELAQPGVVVWQSHDEVSKSRRRTRLVAGGLGALAALWLTGLSGGTDGNTLLGLGILEVFTTVPMIVAMLRARRLSKLIDRMKTRDADEQEDDADELRHVDETLFRIARLAAQLQGEVAQTAGYESVAAAERAGEEWRRLVGREHDLERIIETTASVAARASLEQSLRACRKDAAVFQSEVEELAAALAQLVDASDEDPIEADVARLQTAGERMDALAMSFREVNALADQSMGGETAMS